MSRPTPAFALATILLGLASTITARADVVITLGDVMLAPGATGMMDISITSNSQDTLSSFGLDLLITPSTGATSLLQFTTAQADPYGNPNYVFAGQSFNSDNGLPFWAAPGGTNYPSDTIQGGDSNNSTLGFVTLGATVGSPLSYLATVRFQAPSGANPGDGFLVSLVNDSNFTYFNDQNGNLLNDSSTPGTVTIATVVPEPSSSALLAIGGLSGLLWYRRNRRTSH